MKCKIRIISEITSNVWKGTELNIADLILSYLVGCGRGYIVPFMHIASAAVIPGVQERLSL